MPYVPAMTAPTLIIANPAARSGRLGRDLAALRMSLESALGPVLVHATSRPREAEDIARNLPAGTARVIAVGGDGTLNEVMCGLVAREDRVALGIVPFGSGNDLARALKVPFDTRRAVALLGSSHPVAIDTGEVSWQSQQETHSRRFVNAVGIGLDAWSAAIAPRYKGWPFGVGYSIAVLQALRTWIPAGVSIRETEGRVLYSGPLMFMTVGNAPDSGGGYRLNPHARLRDGLIDACIVEGISRKRAVAMLPTARTGAHLKAPEVRYEQLVGLSVAPDRGLPIHTDGEMCTVEGRAIQIRVHPGSLDVHVDPAHADQI